MRSTRAIVMILLSLIAGAAAVVLATRWVGQQAAENTTTVVVAVHDLDLGAPLTAAMLQETKWPSNAVPVSSFNDIKKLEGRVVRAPVFKGEPILEPKLAPEGTKGGLSSVIQGGKRAISVKVNEVVGVAGFALPGSFVDVMVNIRETNNNKDSSVSKIVLQRILVLAVAQEASRDETKPKVVNAVTLEVTPDEAERIDLARSIGTLSLVLRNPLDRNDTETAGMRREELLAYQKQKAPPPPVVQAAAQKPPAKNVRRASVAKKPAAAPSKASVEVIRGVQKANSEF